MAWRENIRTVYLISSGCFGLRSRHAQFYFYRYFWVGAIRPEFFGVGGGSWKIPDLNYWYGSQIWDFPEILKFFTFHQPEPKKMPVKIPAWSWRCLLLQLLGLNWAGEGSCQLSEGTAILAGLPFHAAWFKSAGGEGNLQICQREALNSPSTQLILVWLLLQSGLKLSPTVADTWAHFCRDTFCWAGLWSPFKV